jgi:hypothetical protein
MSEFQTKTPEEITVPAEFAGTIQHVTEVMNTVLEGRIEQLATESDLAKTDKHTARQTCREHLREAFLDLKDSGDREAVEAWNTLRRDLSRSSEIAEMAWYLRDAATVDMVQYKIADETARQSEVLDDNVLNSGIESLIERHELDKREQALLINLLTLDKSDIEKAWENITSVRQTFEDHDAARKTARVRIQAEQQAAKREADRAKAQAKAEAERLRLEAERQAEQKARELRHEKAANDALIEAERVMFEAKRTLATTLSPVGKQQLMETIGEKVEDMTDVQDTLIRPLYEVAFDNPDRRTKEYKEALDDIREDLVSYQVGRLAYKQFELSTFSMVSRAYLEMKSIIGSKEEPDQEDLIRFGRVLRARHQKQLAA